MWLLRLRHGVVDRAAFAKDEIAFANVWGVADESLYGRAMREADADFARGQPFFQLIMTTSNHVGTHMDGEIHFYSAGRTIGACGATNASNSTSAGCSGATGFDTMTL